MTIHNNLKPFGEQHAIKTMAFALEFISPLEVDAFLQLLSLHSEWQDFLPRKISQQALHVNLDRVIGAGGQPASKQELSGVIFDRIGPDGNVEWGLNVSSERIVVACTKYTRWAEIWSQSRNLLEKVAPICLSHQPIKSVGLQYTDEYIWNGEISDFRANLLFKADSLYLTPNVFNLENLWHCHHGYFVDFTDPIKYRRHDTLNIDLLEQDKNMVVRIQTTHRSLPDKVFVDPKSLFENIDMYMEKMHDENKNLLSNLIVDEMLEKISLKHQP